jgi:hypothetical protein
VLPVDMIAMWGCSQVSKPVTGSSDVPAFVSVWLWQVIVWEWLCSAEQLALITAQHPADSCSILRILRSS